MKHACIGDRQPFATPVGVLILSLVSGAHLGPHETEGHFTMPSMLSVAAFCADNGLSRSLFYRLLKDGRGPRLTKVLRRTLISSEAAAEWRARMERETEQAVLART